ncbi:golgin subfamily A member 5 [Aplysia californica]|uniref:Golgin subfamily A member 5 n=1 Tax=Aplysia californica TaxID=6500 RepID=A0ABM0JQJ3_APLCA|nr:golgin subfamily A member 5 [Aplysia californica]XP_005099212.1 golgin subfamily A member 5 [Aplysia californica]XP_005099213.1 golgin subfamily A member 5 [Aplysia californica]
MSWFSAVTGKAEDFLNRLDKSAADVLHIDETEKVTPAPLKEPVLTESSFEPAFGKPLSPSQSVPSRLHSYKDEVDKSSSFVSAPIRSVAKVPAPVLPAASSSSPPSAPTTQTSGKTVKKKDSDDALFDFLNSKDASDSTKKRRTPVSSQHHSRQSSTSSIISSKSAKPDNLNISAVATVVEPTVAPSTTTKAPTAAADTADEDGNVQRDSPTNSHTSADVDVIADAMKESPVASDQSNPESDHAEVPTEQRDRQFSSLELENRLLRNEVASLNQEMASVIQRAKEAETELSRSKEKLHSQSNSAAMHDQLVRELQARESDLTEALNAKDSQLAVLRVRLDEADRKVSSREQNLEEVKLERERILRDHSDSSGLHGQALDSMKEKLEEVEAALRREQLAYKQAQQEAGERQSRLEQEQRSMAEAVKTAEKRLSEEKAKISELSGQLKAAKTTADSSRRELTDYKDKAARILQSKEKLIASLRDGAGPVGESGGVSSLEHESMRQERDMMREELQQTKLTVENLRMELQDVENQLQQDSDTSQETIRSLEDSLRDEKRRREDAENELLTQKQELQYSIEELHKQKTAFQTRINDRESEIEKLRNQLMTKSMSSSTEGELESRVRSLTESLIQKQTVLEALSTEKNSLVLQLERMEQQFRDMESAAPRPPAGTQMVAVNDHDDDVRHRLPMFLREVPSDHEMTRRMKRAANSIDGFSIRLGVFLRRYPMARVFVILYMALLHVWVLIVMMTYQPEIHGADSQPKPPSDDP